MASFEKSLGVSSTYFVMLTSEFYNPAAAANAELLNQIFQMGHKIGLHFDETKYGDKPEAEVKRAAEQEREILEKILGVPITAISMHRPSKGTLEANWAFESMINSYGTEFFKKFKYVSDSRMHWREDVEAIIRSHEYDRLHILTHAFWYGEKEADTRQRLINYLEAAKIERYDILNQNFRDLSEFIARSELYSLKGAIC